MGLLQQPTSFFGGGIVIQGDTAIQGKIDTPQVEIGRDSKIVEGATAVGRKAKATGNLHSVGIGRLAEATGNDATAIGTEAKAVNRWNTVIGYDAGAKQSTVGLEPNGKNIVLIGRKAQASGDNAVAIGEDSRANGKNSSALGRQTQVFGDNSSAFGQGAVVNAFGSTVVGQGGQLTDNNATLVGTDVTVTGVGATGIGNGAEATGENATAVGSGAVANGVNSLAIGTNSTTNQDNTFSFGDRNVNLPIGRSFLYPTNAGVQTLADLPVDNSVSEGVRQEYSFDIGGESIFILRAEADGSGGIKNIVGKINGSFALEATQMLLKMLLLVI
jgi:Hep_Hag.